MTDKHPLSDELRKLADLARRQSDDAGPDEIAYALRQAADEIERLQSPPSMDLWARRVGILTTERDSLKQQLVDTRAMNEVNCETLRRWHQRAEAAEAREVGLRKTLEEIADERRSGSRPRWWTVLAQTALSQHAEPPLLKEVRLLREKGDQMYRAIVYTSGVSLNFAADEWKAIRAHEKAAGEVKA